ncbi:carbohydrate ABC transporter permease [Pseudonocardia sichuanensis]|uniref:Carbohydrate ABC transporter membrane protein 1 (CUT1 family) n=1 Tax=Pseudonocardia kunmingensis TaxID=630975 RepID=A0A543D9C6_9PSEU|nr:sugar ABC transporter permease [Pseudonocardia kunmingensis]TQM05933.1 carbohydrate ABC transporter membrane protein 1 (CUT1 family) [Pseudonocardia kunmingensis]
MTAVSLNRTAGRASTGRAPLTPMRKRERRAAFLFLLPDSLGLLVFVVVPMILAIGLAFFSLDGFGHLAFIGVDNYLRLAQDPQFWASLRTTAIYVVVTVPVMFVVSLALAVLVKERFPGVGIVRSALFLPYVISLVVVGMVWQFMLTDKVGVVSRALAVVGLDGISPLGSPNLALTAVILISVWFQMGYYMIIFLAGLQDIPGELYEAARVDGASPWQQFRGITLPLLAPTSFFVLLTSTIAVVTGGLDLVYVLTQGGPAGATSVLIFFVYEQAFLFGEYGYAAAVGSILLVGLLAWSALMFFLTRGGRFSHADD